MSVVVIKQGIADSIQDTGRYGWQHLGINPDGAMDKTAAAVANILVNNAMECPVIEMSFPAPVLLFEQQALVALSGADFSAWVNDVPVPLNTPFIIQKNCVLQFRQVKAGAWCYLAVNGGFVLEPWMGSYSTNTLAGSGGYKGRYLKKHDELLLQDATDYSALLEGKDVYVFHIQADAKQLYLNPDAIPVIASRNWKALSPEAQQQFLNNNYIVQSNSNRMGYYLQSEPILLNPPFTVLSTAVTNGTIQLLPNGQCIVLLSGHQTTGGYPIPATVCSAAIPTLAQVRPHQILRFQTVTLKYAHQLMQQQHLYLLQLQYATQNKLNELFTAYAIY
ncbi:MAG: 5-oxoprolinase/urea amidolyase family protein [Sphingobacteriales bacterium]|uniref:5-oxoprolinase subunit C family protein n=1 Tax=Hydrotalea flava TaxID=714549 RepID=UPI00082A800C|nr:biotin-dependent carboxyltransferase family protein [Hydrotalea flava]RTL52398.1 MAG: 5-oxoprolinase/urea amidolyase family protein [Sphingobacteriales bacterium]